MTGRIPISPLFLSITTRIAYNKGLDRIGFLNECDYYDKKNHEILT